MQQTQQTQTQYPKNFRDVGETLKTLDLTLKNQVPVGKIFRGGQIEFLSHQSLGSPSTIINLRMLKDEELIPGVKYLHFPIANNVDVYNTRSKEVKNWLNDIIKSFERDQVTFPVYVHCFAGKDRTGVVIAALLFVLGIKTDIIVKEYLFTSDNVKELDIKNALKEIEKIGNGYFRGVNIDKIRSMFLSMNKKIF